MKPSRLRALALSVVLAAFSLAAVRSHCWAQEPNKPSELAVKIGQLCREKKVDEAVALVRAKAAENSPAAEVPLMMFRVGQLLYMEEKYDQSLELLKEIASRFPKAPAASLAWCGMGQVYGRLGKNEEMIAALERGMSAPRVWTEMGVMDAGDTHGYACEVLGRHYVRTGQWGKGLRVYREWNPRSWCGTCLASMESTRQKNILLCLSRLALFPEMVDFAWHDSVRGGWFDEGLAPFVLVRVYAEAGQLDDLRSLNTLLVESAREKLGADEAESENNSIARATESLNESLTTAINLAESRRFSDHIATFQDHEANGRHGRSGAVHRHVAAWVLIHQHARTVPTLLKAARDKSSAGDELTQLLSAIDSRAARSALELLAKRATPERRQFIKYLADQREARQAKDRMSEEWPNGGEQLPLEFYEAWPAAPKGSLPTTLPADLFKVKREP